MRFKFSLLVLLGVLLSSFAFAAANYTAPDDESLPARAIAISDTRGGVEWIESFMDAALEASAEPVDYIIESSQMKAEDVLKIIENFAAKKFSNAEARASYMGKWEGRIHVYSSKRPTNWQQDILQGFYNPATGVASVRAIGEYRWDLYKENQARVIDVLSKIGFKVEAPIPVRKAFPEIGGFFGGNFESGPNGICFIGSDSLNRQDATRLYPLVCEGPDSVPIFIDTSYLRVGHVDEILKTIPLPNEKAPCNSAFAIASPRKARELMQKNPKDLFFHNPKLSKEEAMKRSGFQWYRWCELIREAQAPATEETSDPAHGSGWLRKALLATAYAESTEAKPFNLEEEYLYGPGSEAGCTGVTNAQFLDALKSTSTDAYNDKVQASLDEVVEDIKKVMATASPGCPVRIIEVPQLFDGHGGAESGLRGSNAVSILPNPTNSVHIEGTLISPEPYSDTFGKHLETEYQKLGIKYRTVDTFFAHMGLGNLHCSTNVFRMPRETPAVKP